MTRQKRQETAQKLQAKPLKAVLVDTNLLLVFVVGSYQPLYVSKHKNTRGYTSEDFYRLQKIVGSYKVRLTTPHILTEVSNLLAQSDGPVKSSCFQAFARVIGLLEELPVSATQISTRPHFAEFGLTDLGILEAAGSTHLVLTADSRLARYLAAAQIDVLDYNVLREDH